jgi:hypothetical protein
MDELDTMDLAMDFASQKRLFEKRGETTKSLLVDQALQIRQKIDQVRILL